jgi:carbon monoxide dehydrogenase subunit G
MDSCRRRSLQALSLLLITPGLLAAGASPPARIDEDDIQVRRQGETWTVEAQFVVPVPPSVAWEVLTDFDNMTAILTNLSSSRVLSRQGQVLQVEQKGRARFGIFSFESLREITLTPRRRIQARGLAGNTRQFESDMVLAPTDGGTRFSYRVAMVPDFWLPSLLGPSLLQHELAEQFNAMAAEMEKRNAVRR